VPETFARDVGTCAPCASAAGRRRANVADIAHVDELKSQCKRSDRAIGKRGIFRR
jgi:hypothetical protein